MKVLFITGRLARASKEIIRKSVNFKELSKLADVEVIVNHDEKTLIEKVKDIDIIITAAPISAITINAAKKLKLIQTISVGYDHIDIGAVKKNGIVICNVAEVNANSVAELTFGLILDLARKISAHDRYMRSQKWERIEPNRQIEIRNKTLGIIGLGAIGSRVAQIGKNAFNMKILVYDPYITKERASQFGGNLVDLHTIMEKSDVVTVHVPLNDETKHMISEKELSLLKPNAIFINTSRGSVVNENALIKILKEKKINGAGLDVFEREPLQNDSQLRILDNVVIIPHIGSTPSARKNMRDVAMENVIRVIKGEEPFRIKTPEIYYSSPKWSKWTKE